MWRCEFSREICRNFSFSSIENAQILDIHWLGISPEGKQLQMSLKTWGNNSFSSKFKVGK